MTPVPVTGAHCPAELTIADYLQIQNLIFRYPYLLDAGRFDEMGQLFARADIYIAGDLVVRSDARAVSELWSKYVRIYPNNTPRTHHIATNLMIEADGPGAIRTHSYILVVQNPPDVPLAPITAGDYLDRFVKDGDTWYFSERHIGNDLFGDMSHHLREPMAIDPDARPQRWDIT
ncbi:nuclear transport factor 2 family protein [Rhodococcus sp. NPDC056960]|uniref:nuclear transport factor 2 family protein n=1 Tax=Rhodococcus sp. NPDC056960 TaxID=3345982 RepID=UPI00362A6EBC